ncbi:autotransporter outer membrane beta-barrel domain-containing protein [Pseudomonas fontis]|uniref:Autotransporter outer membrane beta-barrel domain-containing protein n=1 Tax=Pseudomonas fontis TaxID=2942633 RepID=A0ABT5NKJ5_9PSED|nr:autotransporter outer membrane beta-barrel domain-containing protein [Pseudomonas fontis]MDD0976182.1 autotransporter outer membrane beta-barrel domain-containing protein [Pseudomonas fontis]MDD0989055.1 autotransporter outer membrane beta-barrel domain-containing protein [Pseudomonas fontis]
MRASLIVVLSALPLASVADNLVVNPGDSLGAIVQTPLIDDFKMFGGTVQSLAQGDGRDTFLMESGTIVGAFEDGDVATQTGGSIGRVDMKLDNNIYNMSGGTIIGNLVTGFGNDTITVSGASKIGGNISTSGGVDIVTVTGGDIGGNILLSAGNDVFNWNTGGLIHGLVQMGIGDDQATLTGLSETQLSSTALINGDTGNDTLVFDQTTTSVAARYTGWENIALIKGSKFDLNDPLVLGDSASGTGILSVDGQSTISSRSGSITSAVAGQHVTVTNAGTIDLTGGNDAQGRLTINGNYTGNSGTLKLNSVLAGDGAASDRLVVNQGAISGTTNLTINNLKGAGALTSQNGIQVVEAANGATSSNGAFVQTQTLSAGAFDYRLFKGGVTAGSENSWYLRSTVVAPVALPPADQPQPVVPPAVSVPVAAPAPNQPALPQAVAGKSIPLYRPEVAVYAAAPRAAALVARSALGTFHQRQGDQDLLQETGAVSASWGQAYGSSFHQSWSGTVSPSLDGNLYGFKVGQDLYAWLSDSGYRQHVGVYLGHGRIDGDVKGFALGTQDTSVGDLRIDSDSVGAYWTLIGPQRWYVDAVVQHSSLDGRARSDRGAKLDLDGHAWTGSLEVGYPFALSPEWSLEPQAQIIAQKVSLDSANDSVAHVSYDAQTELTGRLGVRLEGKFKSASVPLQPYLQANVWHGDGGRDTLTFDNVDQIKTDYRTTSMDVGTGLVAQINANFSVHAGIDYSTNLDARQQERVGANLGLRLSY